MQPTTPVFDGYEKQEIVYAKNQPEYLPLAVYMTDDGIAVTRWKLTLSERLRLIFGGSIWLSILSGKNRRIQPVKLDVKPPLNPGLE